VAHLLHSAKLLCVRRSLTREFSRVRHHSLPKTRALPAHRLVCQRVSDASGTSCSMCSPVDGLGDMDALGLGPFDAAPPATNRARSPYASRRRWRPLTGLALARLCGCGGDQAAARGHGIVERASSSCTIGRRACFRAHGEGRVHPAGSRPHVLAMRSATNGM